MAPSLDCREGAVRLRDPSSQLPPWRFARCEVQRCQVAAQYSSCASEAFLFWSVAVWNYSVDGSSALKEIHAIIPFESLKAVATTSPAPVCVLLPPMHSAHVNTFVATKTHIRQSASTGETPLAVKNSVTARCLKHTDHCSVQAYISGTSQRSILPPTEVKEQMLQNMSQLVAHQCCSLLASYKVTGTFVKSS